MSDMMLGFQHYKDEVEAVYKISRIIVTDSQDSTKFEYYDFAIGIVLLVQH